MEKFFENMARNGGISLFKAQKAKRMDVFKREKKMAMLWLQSNSLNQYQSQ